MGKAMEHNFINESITIENVENILLQKEKFPFATMFSKVVGCKFSLSEIVPMLERDIGK